jgi:hypothetical protein
VNRSGAQAAGSTEDQARALLQALVVGPSAEERASGLRSALPQGARLTDVSISGDSITVKLILPEWFLYGGLDPLVSDEINEQVIKTLYPIEGLRKFNVLALDPRSADGAFKPLSYFLFEPPVTHQEGTEGITPYGISTLGALTGKAVYLSAGHGWYWDGYWGDWRTQRYADGGYQIIEDMNNAEVVNQYLIQYLRNAGADVWPVREHDMNTQEMTITHDQPAYSETGAWAASTLTDTGYQGQLYRYTSTVTGTATATATWTFTPTASGRYAVYAWYKPGSDRAPDAQYLIAHDGGTTEVRVDQRAHGALWRYIGAFPFAANTPGTVMLTNQSATASTIVIADAVRVGGGMGSELGGNPPISPPSPGISGKPRWEEASRYWVKYQGLPSSIYAPSYCHNYYNPGQDDLCDDVTVRPRYAEWTHPSGEDAVLLSWHTNASGIGARGTESYIYNGGATAGSDQLQSLVHTALINDIRAGWESSWTDRGMLEANFGELRPLQTLPGTLVEIAFHDQSSDANALKDPRFAQLTARAMYKGVVRYFAQKDGTTPAILPEPPRNLIVRNSGPGQVTVSWRPSPTDTLGLLGDAATGYRVYTSTNGLGWGAGVTVTSTALTLTGLAPNQLVFFRVTATNAGGESVPTPVAAARVAETEVAPVLIVNGYERIDRWMDVQRCDTPSANCPNQRIWPAQMNDQSYVIQHAMAISLPLDSAVRAALDSQDVALDGYGIVDWIAGQEQTPAPSPNGTSEVALTNAEQVSLTAFLNSGRALFLSGSEVAFDLATNLGKLSFLTGTLRAQFAWDDANTFTVTPSASGILSGLAPFSFDDGGHGSYAVSYPDVLTPTNGSLTALNYVGGTGGAAGIQYTNGCRRLVYFGFPFETVYPVSTRQVVMARVMSFLGACLNLSPSANIISPTSGGYYNHTPPISGVTSGWTPADHVDVAMIDITHSLFLSGTSWVAAQTWMSATGSTTWAFTPSVSLADGPYAVWGRAWTTSGLASAVAVISFTMDTISPTTPIIITPTGGITLPGASATLVFSPSTDANGVAGYTIQVDRALSTTTATSFPASLPAGTHTWAVHAFDAAGNASDWVTATFATQSFLVYLPFITRNYSPSPPITQCLELVSNGGFETQDVWYSLSVVKPTYVYSPGIIHSGLASLLIGYTTTVGAPTYGVYSSIQQTVTIPLTATRTTLTFWRYAISGDTKGDFQYLAVGNSPTAVSTIWITRTNEQVWTPTTIDLSAYSGALTIRIGVYNDGKNDVSAMYLDDISVQSCSP